MMIIIPPEFLWVKSIGRQSKHECTFWPINTANQIWRPRAKAWFLKLPCLTWSVVKIIVSPIKTSRNWRGIPHFHTPSFYINIDQLLKVSKKTLRIRIGKTWWSHRVGHGDRRNTAARQKNNSLGAAVALAHCGDPGESPTETPKKGGPSNAWIMSTGWLPTIRGTRISTPSAVDHQPILVVKIISIALGVFWHSDGQSLSYNNKNSWKVQDLTWLYIQKIIYKS